jgi:hypothetical protein
VEDIPDAWTERFVWRLRDGPLASSTYRSTSTYLLSPASNFVSLKWQQVGGTAEQKVPFEVMCLADAVRAGHAYLVLGGDGWT